MADAKNITVNLGGFDLAPFMQSVYLDTSGVPGSLSVELRGSADGVTWETIAQRLGASFSIEGTWDGWFSVDHPEADAHAFAWNRHLEAQAERGLDQVEAAEAMRRIDRRIRKAERAHERLARAPKLDWWGK